MRANSLAEWTLWSRLNLRTTNPVFLAAILSMWVPVRTANAVADCSATALVVKDVSYCWPETNKVVLINVLSFASSPDTPLTLSAVGNAQNGTVSITGNQWAQFVPTNFAKGSGSFSYTVKDSAGRSGTGTVTLSDCKRAISGGQGPSFTWNCQGITCFFNVVPATWLDLNSFTWNFGDGQTQANWRGTNFTHRFTSVPSGASCNTTTHPPFNVTLTAFYADGSAPSTMAQVCVVDTTPYVTWTADDTGGLSLKTIVLSTNVGMDWPYVAYCWDFGDGTAQECPPNLPQGPQATADFHLYQTPGIYKVTLWVKQFPGQSNEVDTPFPLTVTVHNNAPTPDFVASSAKNDLDWTFTPVNFIDEHPESAGPYEWSFGDGSYSSTPRPTAVTHIFSSPGKRDVTLRVTDSLGLSAAIAKPVDVETHFTVGMIPTCDPYVPTCQFAPTASVVDNLAITSYQWTFGDGTSATSIPGQAVSHAYSGNGEYLASVTPIVSNFVGDAKSRFVEVNSSPPSAGLLFYAVPPCVLWDSNQSGVVTNGVQVDVLAAGRCGIPASALALSMNFIETGATSGGYVRIFGKGNPTPLPTVLNFQPAIYGFSANGIVDLKNGWLSMIPLLASGASAKISLAVTGYLAPSATPVAPATGPYAYLPLQVPCLLVNSASPQGALYTSAIPVGNAAPTEFFPIYGGSPPCDVKSPEGAAFLNVNFPDSSVAAAFGIGAAKLGVPSVALGSFPANSPVTHATVSMLGTRPGDQRPINLVMQYMPSGSPSTTNFEFDSLGYFIPPASGGLLFHPIPPCRLLDSRDPRRSPWSESSTGPLTDVPNVADVYPIPAALNCGVPSNAKALAFSAVIVSPTGPGSITFFPNAGSPGPLPSIRFTAGSPILNNGLIVPLDSTGWLAAYVKVAAGPGQAGSVHLIVDVTGYFASN